MTVPMLRSLLCATLAAIGLTLLAAPAPASAQLPCLPGLTCTSPSPSPPPPPPPSSPPPPPPASGPAPTGPTPRPPEPKAGCGPAYSRKASSTFVGMVAEDVLAGGPNYRSCTLGRLVGIGVTVLRQTFDWSYIERRRGRYDFSYYDAYVGALAQHGIHVLPILFHPPRFRSSRPRSHAARGTYPPRRYADRGRFGAALARHYGPGGSFWRRHPELPPTPIRAWQIWNEPNLKVYWPRGPNAAQYVRLLRAGARGIKRVDHGAEIVTAGIPQSRGGVPLKRYVAAMYRAHARSAFDTLAVNPYGPTTGKVVSRVAGVRRLMNAHHDSGARIWVTEFGWATAGPRNPFNVGPSGQAARISSALQALSARRGALGLRGVVYFNWKDLPVYRGGKDFWGLHTGLLERSGNAKPGLNAFGSTANGIS